MALITTDLTGEKINKVQRSIERIKSFEPPEGYYLCFSGGKDSIVIKTLADMAGVKYDAHYNVTTVDPPELVRFIRARYPEVSFNRPKLSMRQLIIKKMSPPTRIKRYCCEALKEVKGDGRVAVTGTRWAESVRRKNNQGVVTLFSKSKKLKKIVDDSDTDYKIAKNGGIIMNMDNDSSRRVVELCYRTNRTIVNPIIDWEDDDIWEFIRAENIPYCSLYDEGWNRLGCIGCPLTTYEKRMREFDRWPVYYKVYLHAFADMLDELEKNGKNRNWEDANDVMNWWLGIGINKPIKGQISFDDIEP